MENNTQFQDLEWAIPRIHAQIKENKKRGMGASVSGLFSMLRKERHLSLMGDYFLFWIILSEVKTTSSKLSTALRKSKEYNGLQKREKMLWLKNLMGKDSSKWE